MACIKLFLNELSLQYNLLDYVTWSLDQAPHAVIFGNTGSGKTYASPDREALPQFTVLRL